MNIIVYSKSACPNCDTAKQLLDSKGLDFQERSIDEIEWRDAFTRQRDVVHEELLRFGARRAFPRIVALD